MMISLTRETGIHWRGAVLAAAALLLSVPGCGQETAIVIEVTRGELAAEPDTLRFFVGVDAGELDIAIPGCGTAARFVDESGDSGSAVAIEGRDLATDPYRLLLKPEGALPLDQELMVVVVALQGEQVLATGSLQAPVRFVPDKALEWQVKVESLVDTVGILGSGCACAQLGSGGVVAVTPTEDRDCDGDVGADDCNDHDAVVGKTKSEVCLNQVDDDCDGATDEPEDADGDLVNNCKGDCNDRNAAVYPEAPEICDGFDNNCIEGDEYPGHVSCYVEVSGECYLGKRACNDLDPLSGGWQGDCTPLGVDPQFIAPRDACAAFDLCTGDLEYGDGFECANVETFVAVECTQYVISDANSAKTLCPGRVPLLGPADGVCTWTLLGGENQGPYVASLLSDATGDAGPVVNDCVPELIIRELSEEPYETSMRLWLEVDGSPFQRVQLKVTPVVAVENICPEQGQGLVCGPWPQPALR